MENDKYIIKQLLWDSDFFKVKTAKIILKKTIILSDIYIIKKFIKENNYKFIVVENVGNNEDNNKIIYKLGNIFLSDVHIKFQKKVNKVTIPKVQNTKIKNNLAENPEILEISRNEFKYSRFIIDDKLKNGNKVYEQWAKNAFKKQDKFFCYYTIHNKIKGYILFSNIEKEQSIQLELIAVNHDYTNNGIGTSLIQKLENYAFEHNIKYINVCTQLNNIIAQNFYINNKFVHIENDSIYHWWKE